MVGGTRRAALADYRVEMGGDNREQKRETAQAVYSDRLSMMMRGQGRSGSRGNYGQIPRQAETDHAHEARQLSLGERKAKHKAQAPRVSGRGREQGAPWTLEGGAGEARGGMIKVRKSRGACWEVLVSEGRALYILLDRSYWQRGAAASCLG
jgi:hypothetical protein